MGGTDRSLVFCELGGPSGIDTHTDKRGERPTPAEIAEHDVLCDALACLFRPSPSPLRGGFLRELQPRLSPRTLAPNPTLPLSGLERSVGGAPAVRQRHLREGPTVGSAAETAVFAPQEKGAVRGRGAAVAGGRNHLLAFRGGAEAGFAGALSHDVRNFPLLRVVLLSVA